MHFPSQAIAESYREPEFVRAPPQATTHLTAVDTDFACSGGHCTRLIAGPGESHHHGPGFLPGSLHSCSAAARHV